MCLVEQAIPTDDAIERANFYAAHNISFVARPPIKRRGVFKKASNLNYQLAVSERINTLIRENAHTTYDDALLALWDEWDKEFVAGGDLSMDEDCLILLIDADTRVRQGSGMPRLAWRCTMQQTQQVAVH